MSDKPDQAEEKETEKLGMIKITEEAIAMLCSGVVLRMEGIAAMSGGLTESISKSFLGKSSPTKGIKVTLGEEEVTADLYTIVKYGVKIPEVAWNVQRNIKNEIENATGYKVKAINIHVQGVAFEDEE